MSGRPKNLTAAALRHGLRSDVSIEDAGAELAGMVNGDRRLIEVAVSRIRGALTQRPGPVGRYAREALELALALSQPRFP